MSTFKINKGVVDNLESSLSGKSSTDLDNLSQTGEAHFANSALSNSPYTTNRILEIPQDIKLELNDGVLTLKAGSKVYVPNGFEEDGVTNKFYTRNISDDRTATDTRDGKWLIFTSNSDLVLDSISISSGTSFPSNPYTAQKFYNITNNKFYRYDGTSWLENGYSLPLAIITVSNGAISSIDQVFNGFGFMGSTVFALPGVKGEIPNGRNVNGTCKNIPFTTEKVYVSTITENWTNWFHLVFSLSSNILYFGVNNAITWDSENNYWYYNTDPSYKSYLVIADLCLTSGKVTSWKPLSVDSVANSNASNFSQAGRSYLSGLGMPSRRYIDLTLLASGSTYTAPANGWFCLAKQSTATGQYIYMGANGGGAPSMTSASYATSGHVQCSIPCLKGMGCQVKYTVAGTAAWFRFVYAEGENS